MISKNQIKRIVSLQQKKFRKELQLFVAEGHKVINEFINEGWEVEQIFTTDAALFHQKNLNIELISEAELNKISALTTPNDCLAVVKIPQPINTKKSGWTVVLDDIKDPGNAGTIIRLCDWFGIETMVCSPETVDVFNPKVVQASMGSLARVSVVYQALEVFLGAQNKPVYGTFMNGTSVYETTFTTEGILVLGNEANGISTKIEQKIEQKIAIPRFGRLQKTESLNVATATAIFLSEIRRKTS